MPDINKKFFDIINQEDWGDVSVDDNDPTIQREYISQYDVPLGNMILPTPIPRTAPARMAQLYYL